MDRPVTLLRIDAGVDHPYSTSRPLADELVASRVAEGVQVIHRDVSRGVPVVDGAWLAAAFGGAEPAPVALSESLMDELKQADEIVIVAPVYNLSIPAALKTYIDQVVRIGHTFDVTPDGPVKKIKATRAWIVTASGSTTIGSEYDFNTPYLRAILGFLGVYDVQVLVAEKAEVPA